MFRKSRSVSDFLIESSMITLSQKLCFINLYIFRPDQNIKIITYEYASFIIYISIYLIASIIVQKMKFSIKDFFSKCEQIHMSGYFRSKVWIKGMQLNMICLLKKKYREKFHFWIASFLPCSRLSEQEITVMIQIFLINILQYCNRFLPAEGLLW